MREGDKREREREKEKMRKSDKSAEWNVSER